MVTANPKAIALAKLPLIGATDLPDETKVESILASHLWL